MPASDPASLHTQLAPARERLHDFDADTVAAQVEVTEIAAPTGDEAERAAWVANRLRALALADVHIDDAGNVVATRDGANPERDSAVVVCAHLDTVFPRDAVGAVRREGKRLHAPGIGDNGRGLATLLALARVVDGRTLRTHAAVRFVATTGEEGHGDLRGAKHHFATNGASAAIALDGTGDRSIVHRAVGSRRYRVTIDGPGGHSWSDFGIANPLHACGAAISQLAALPGHGARDASLSVTRASGGLSVNSIPSRAWFEVDVRATAQDVLINLDRSVRGIVNTAMAAANAVRRPGSAPLSFEIIEIGNRPCGELPETEPLVAAAIDATRLIGREPELATASTDANVPLALGIPAIALGGGGRGGDVHTTGEWYENAAGVNGIARALHVLVVAAGGIAA